MKNLEDKLQAACVNWFRYQHPNLIIFAIPNGGSRNSIEAAKLKRTGTLAGVADLFIMSPSSISRARHGLFIEMKAGKNKQTSKQKEFEARAVKSGYEYQVCRSLDEFINIVNEYLR